VRTGNYNTASAAAAHRLSLVGVSVCLSGASILIKCLGRIVWIEGRY
jgi:hypothetical protein